MAVSTATDISHRHTGENVVLRIATSFLIGSSSHLQITRPVIKSLKSDFGLDRTIHFGVTRP